MSDEQARSKFKVAALCDHGRIPPTQHKGLVVSSFTAAVRTAVADMHLSDGEVNRLTEIAKVFDTDSEEIETEAKSLLIQFLTLQDLQSGVVQSRIGGIDHLGIA
jgi:hypothetical protein